MSNWSGSSSTCCCQSRNASSRSGARFVTTRVDLAIVGAGIAGLTAANRAAELGCRVLVLEKGEDEHYPCNSRIATGVLNVAHTDPHSDPKMLRQAIELDTEGFAAPALADALAGIASQSMQWLRAEGARIIKVPIHGKSRWMLAPPRTLSAGLDWKGRGPDVVLQTLRANLKRRGARSQHDLAAAALEIGAQ